MFITPVWLNLGFIVITVGHRGGTPMRGKAHHTYGYNNMRDYPLADDKYAIEQKPWPPVIPL